ncbi:MAG: hypothetical protein HOP17_16060 [Acidobacteria bacterium]|nr:hypothetical protein [Acidobacteriota bacterium]
MTNDKPVASANVGAAQPSIAISSPLSNESSAEILARLNKIFSVTSSHAQEIAREKLVLPLDATNSLVPCDGGIAWRVVYKKENKEVWVAKNSGVVYSPPINISNNIDYVSRVPPSSVNETEAIEIAKIHFLEYSKNNLSSDDSVIVGLFASVCDLGESWRIYFLSDELAKIRQPGDIKTLPNDHQPDYVIEKSTGKITYFNYYYLKR